MSENTVNNALRLMEYDTKVDGADTTASMFGRELHSHVITDAIRDEKVLKFKVDYNDVRPQFKAIETE